MRLNKVKYLFLILVLILNSCKGKSQEIESVNKTSINFFDKKYFDGYQFIIDESNISDHPFFSYLDCSNEGYFSVHFIPKTKELQNYWTKEYFKQYYNDNDYIENENTIINKLLKNDKYELYNIFAYQIPKRYLKTNGPCSEESIFCIPKSIAIIYLFDQQNKIWKKLKEVQDNKLPPYIENVFFISQFPEYFKSNQSLNINNSKIKNNISEKWYGNYSIWLDYGEIGGEKVGYAITIDITKDSIKATGDGFQIGFEDLLSVKEEGNKLILYHMKNLYGYKQGEDMNPKFIMIEDCNNYYITTPWINSDVITKPNKLGYNITKNN